MFSSCTAASCDSLFACTLKGIMNDTQPLPSHKPEKKLTVIDKFQDHHR